MKKLDLSGQKFGKLTALYENGKTHDGRILWHCICDCGNELDVVTSSLRRGNTKSCGCYHKEQARINHLKHGDNTREKTSRLYSVWAGMKTRCYSSKHPEFNIYGGRGIKVCKEWKESFINFKNWSLNNGYCDSLEIDRIDNNKNYCPENCRFITRKENCNNRRNNVKAFFRGAMRTPSQIADMTGLSYFLIYQRIKKLHWQGEDLALPSRIKNK